MIFTVVIEPEPDGRFSVHVPALHGVHSSGASRLEALERIVEAAELWIEVERRHGREVPPNDPVSLLAEVSRVISDQRADGLEPQLELVSVAIPVIGRQAA